jgi:hypothetical protein
LISPDLETGQWIDAIESGKALVILVHTQTLMSCGTGLGMAMLRRAIERAIARYANRLHWHTPGELCAVAGVREGSQLDLSRFPLRFPLPI